MSDAFVFGRFELLPEQRRLLERGAPVTLGSRAFDLLVELIEQRERVVSKDELLRLVWPGVVVEENNLTVQISTLRKVLGADAIATVSGHGYRFAREVAGPTNLPSTPADVHPLLTDKPSIAVLPFDNLGGAPEHGHFADGIGEDIITALARFRSLSVIARNSSFAYRNRSVDVRTVARELGVRYVLEGSVRGDGRRVRVAAQLIDAATGSHLWAENYDHARHDAFAVQQEVTQAIVAAITPHIEHAECEKATRVHAGEPSAYELAMRAWACAWVGLNASDRVARAEAMRLARAALALDPRCGSACGAISFLQWQQVYSNTAPSSGDACRDGISAASRAIALDSEDHVAHLWRGLLEWLSGREDAGWADLRRVLELNPNDAHALAWIGLAKTLHGSVRQGVTHATEAIRLNPRGPARSMVLNLMAWVHIVAGDYASGADAARRSLGESPDFAPARLCLTQCLAGLGEVEQARHEFLRWSALAPELVEPRLGGKWLSVDPAYRERMTKYLRLTAGLDKPDAANGST